MTFFPWNTKELLNAYAIGRFPTKARADADFMLFEPDQRALLPVGGMHVSRTLSQKLRKNVFQVTFDKVFSEVMHSCVRQSENWITPELIRIYAHMHAEGWAHSVECWQDETLVGGLYGLSIGGVFYVESMFSLADDASKIATFHLLEECRSQGFQVIDVQFMSPHLESLGAYQVDRFSFRASLETAVHHKTKWGKDLTSLQHLVGVPESLETDRLLIRKLRPIDAQSLFSWHHKAEVHQFTLVQPLLSLDAAKLYIDKAIRDAYSRGIPDPLALCLREDPGIVIGTIGCFQPLSGQPTFELAFDLDPRLWGKGLIVEAARVLIDFVFKAYPVERLQSRCVVQNKASARVLEKLGLHREGILRAAVYHASQFWDMEYYSLLRADSALKSQLHVTSQGVSL